MIINVDLIYPIGSIYMNINNTNPGTLFGGTWEQIQARYLMGAGKPSKNSYNGFGQISDSEIANLNFAPATLGEISHTLTNSEVPATPIFYQIAGTAVGTSYKAYSSVPHGTGPFWSMSLGREGEYTSTANVDGGGQGHNNLPPTLVVYIWKRTA